MFVGVRSGLSPSVPKLELHRPATGPQTASANRAQGAKRTAREWAAMMRECKLPIELSRPFAVKKLVPPVWGISSAVAR